MFFHHNFFHLCVYGNAEGQEESPQRLQIMKVKLVECHGHRLEYYREERILVIDGETNLEVNQKVDQVEEQIDEDVEKGKQNFIIIL